MASCESNCHILLLPVNEAESVKLLRHGDIVYKFKFIRDENLNKLREKHKEEELQLELEHIINNVINLVNQVSLAEIPKTLTITRSKITFHIKSFPWKLSKLICFQEDSKIYYLSSCQFILRLEPKNGDYNIFAPAEKTLQFKSSTPNKAPSTIDCISGQKQLLNKKENTAVCKNSTPKDLTRAVSTVMSSPVKRQSKMSRQKQLPRKRIKLSNQDKKPFNESTDNSFINSQQSFASIPSTQIVEESSFSDSEVNDSLRRKRFAFNLKHISKHGISDISSCGNVDQNIAKEERKLQSLASATLLLQTPKVQIGTATRKTGGIFNYLMSLLMTPVKIFSWKEEPRSQEIYKV